MALSTRKKNIIIADAKAGRYGTVSDLCKHHKITRKTYYKLAEKACIVFGESTDIVDAGVLVEKAKKDTKNIHEINAINKAIEERTEIQVLDDELMLNNRKIAKMLQGRIVANKEDVDIENVRNATTALKDIENIANPQTSKTDISVNTQVQTNVMTIEDKKAMIEEMRKKILQK